MASVENEITKGIIELLTMIKWPCWRQNNNPTPIRRGPKVVGFQKFNGMKGVSDVIALDPKGGPVWWIEVKNPSVGKSGKPGKLSKEQKVFRDLVENCGHIYIVAYSANDVLEELKRRGLWK